MFERAGLVRAMGEEHFLWSADQAIALVAAKIADGTYDLVPASPCPARVSTKCRLVFRPRNQKESEP